MIYRARVVYIQPLKAIEIDMVCTRSIKAIFLFNILEQTQKQNAKQADGSATKIVESPFGGLGSRSYLLGCCCPNIAETGHFLDLVITDECHFSISMHTGHTEPNSKIQVTMNIASYETSRQRGKLLDIIQIKYCSSE